jgi:hypothetical protein
VTVAPGARGLRIVSWWGKGSGPQLLGGGLAVKASVPVVRVGHAALITPIGAILLFDFLALVQKYLVAITVRAVL